MRVLRLHPLGICVTLAALAVPGVRGVPERATRGPPPRARASPPPAWPAETAHAACRVCAAAHALGLRMEPLRDPLLLRCCDGGGVRVEPRGRLRSEDLRTLQVDVDETFEGEGWQVQVRAGAEILHAERFDPVEFRTLLPVPRAVRALLDDHDCEATWGVFAPDGRSVAATLRLEPPTAAAHAILTHIDAERGILPAWVRHLLSAQVLFDEAFDAGARREAEAALALRPAEPHALALLQEVARATGRLADCDVQSSGRDQVRPILARRRQAGLTCDLERERPPPGRRRTSTGPRGGCGG